MSSKPASILYKKTYSYTCLPEHEHQTTSTFPNPFQYDEKIYLRFGIQNDSLAFTAIRNCDSKPQLIQCIFIKSIFSHIGLKFQFRFDYIYY